MLAIRVSFRKIKGPFSWGEDPMGVGFRAVCREAGGFQVAS